jgi:hypothetical protein
MIDSKAFFNKLRSIEKALSLMKENAGKILAYTQMYLAEELFGIRHG